MSMMSSLIDKGLEIARKQGIEVKPGPLAVYGYSNEGQHFMKQCCITTAAFLAVSNTIPMNGLFEVPLRERMADAFKLPQDTIAEISAEYERVGDIKEIQKWLIRKGL